MRTPAVASVAVIAQIRRMRILLDSDWTRVSTVAARSPTTPRPAASWAAARDVASTSAGRTAAVAPRARASPSAAVAGTTPRRASRARSRSRPRATRLLTVPTGQPRCRAASSSVSPSRSHSTTAWPYRAGSRATSSWTTRREVVNVAVAAGVALAPRRTGPRASAASPRPSGRRPRPAGPRRGASRRPSRGGGSTPRRGPGRGTWPGRRPRRRGGRRAPRGRRGGPSARAARPGRRTPAPRPRRRGSRKCSRSWPSLIPANEPARNSAPTCLSTTPRCPSIKARPPFDRRRLTRVSVRGAGRGSRFSSHGVLIPSLR